MAHRFRIAELPSSRELVGLYHSVSTSALLVVTIPRSLAPGISKLSEPTAKLANTTPASAASYTAVSMVPADKLYTPAWLLHRRHLVVNSKIVQE